MKRKILKLSVIILVIFSLLSLSACTFDDSSLMNSQSDTTSSEKLTENQLDCCEKIAQNLSINEIDTAVTLSSSLNLPLSEEEKSIVMEALEDRINNRIKTFLYSFASDSCLISQSTIDEATQYQRILTSVGITDSDYTNIDDYIDSIIHLGSYSEYDDIWVFWKVAMDDWNNGNKYWDLALNSYTDSMRNLHLEKALNSFKNCVTHANNFSEDSVGIVEVKNVAQFFVDRIEYFFNTGNDLTASDVMIDEFQASQVDFQSISSGFSDELGDLPLSVYYGK